jgi:hypothetical protein
VPGWPPHVPWLEPLEHGKSDVQTSLHIAARYMRPKIVGFPALSEMLQNLEVLRHTRRSRGLELLQNGHSPIISASRSHYVRQSAMIGGDGPPSTGGGAGGGLRLWWVRRGISAKLMSACSRRRIQTIRDIAPGWKPRADFGVKSLCQKPVRTKCVPKRNGWPTTSKLTPFPSTLTSSTPLHERRQRGLSVQY